MSEILDDLNQMQRRDAQGMLAILGRFDQQIEEAVGIGEEALLPEKPAGVRQILVSGLGGSAIAGDFVKAYLGPDLRLPLQVNRHYSLPGFVDASTLVLICSYSGNTEETIAAFHEARRARAQMVCLSSNGQLKQLAEAYSLPFVKIPHGYPPRAALGYSAICWLMVLSRLGVISDRSSEIRRSLALVRNKIRAYDPQSPTGENEAKQLALQIYPRFPLTYGSQDRLDRVAIRWRGQFSENGKTLAYSSSLPEMNHNEIVGWKHPETLFQQIVPIFLRDREDHPRVQIRARITRDLLAQKTGTVLEYWSEGDSWLERLWSLILLGDYASVYLAFLNQEDPTPVVVLDYLKSRLKEQDG